MASPPPPAASPSPDSPRLTPPPLDQVQAPPRRRLVKATSMRAHLDDPRKSDGGATPAVTAPPGFGGPVVSDRGQNSSFLSSGATGLGSTSGLPGSMTSGFRERDRALMRSTSKEIPGDHVSGLPYGAGALNPGKPGRSQHISSPGLMEARPLGRRAEGMRRHDFFGGQKHGEELRILQAKRAAVMRAQQAGAPGNFKSFDSPFGNFLIPVIPMHFMSKSQGNDMGGTSFSLGSASSGR